MTFSVLWGYKKSGVEGRRRTEKEYMNNDRSQHEDNYKNSKQNLSTQDRGAASCYSPFF